MGKMETKVVVIGLLILGMAIALKNTPSDMAGRLSFETVRSDDSTSFLDNAQPELAIPEELKITEYSDDQTQKQKELMIALRDTALQPDCKIPKELSMYFGCPT